LIFREKRSKIKLLWKRRRSSSYLNGMSGVQFTRNQDTGLVTDKIETAVQLRENSINVAFGDQEPFREKVPL